MENKNENILRRKKITVSIDTNYKYVQLWNGIFNLTTKELSIISAFIDTNMITEDDNICSVSNKKKVAKLIGLSDYNTLNNYIKKFKDKGAFILSSGMYKLNPFLNPETDVVEIMIRRD